MSVFALVFACVVCEWEGRVWGVERLLAWCLFWRKLFVSRFVVRCLFAARLSVRAEHNAPAKCATGHNMRETLLEYRQLSGMGRLCYYDCLVCFMCHLSVSLEEAIVLVRVPHSVSVFSKERTKCVRLASEVINLSGQPLTQSCLRLENMQSEGDAFSACRNCMSRPTAGPCFVRRLGAAVPLAVCMTCLIRALMSFVQCFFVPITHQQQREMIAFTQTSTSTLAELRPFVGDHMSACLFRFCVFLNLALPVRGAPMCFTEIRAL